LRSLSSYLHRPIRQYDDCVVDVGPFIVLVLCPDPAGRGAITGSASTGRLANQETTESMEPCSTRGLHGRGVASLSSTRNPTTLFAMPSFSQRLCRLHASPSGEQASGSIRRLCAGRHAGTVSPIVDGHTMRAAEVRDLPTSIREYRPASEPFDVVLSRHGRILCVFARSGQGRPGYNAEAERNCT